MIIKIVGDDLVEIEGRFAAILGRTDEFIAVQFPGRSQYKGSMEGVQYTKTWMAVGKIENIGPDGTLNVDPVLQFTLRK